MATYSYIKRHFWALGPAYNSLIVSFLPLMGYLKEISADKEANYNTFSVVWGWDLTVWASDLIYMIVLSGFYFSGWISGFNWVLFFTAVFLAFIAQCNAHFQKVKTEEHAACAIACSIRFFIICCFMIIYAFMPALWVILVVGAIIFEYTLYKRPENSQL